MKISLNRILYSLQRKIIEKSNLFDEKAYVEQYSDLSNLSSCELLRHYIIHGYKEKRNPSYNLLGSELSYHYPKLICPLTLHAIFKKKNILNTHCAFSFLKNNIDKIDKKKIHKLYLEKGEPLEKIALVSMVKDEEDIIYENLCWHHFMGIRKFVIIDNNSTDNTVKLIEKFKEETNSDLILIKDPIKAKIHGRKITGISKLAIEWWHDLEWIIPVDADEFWCIERPLKDILNEVPQNVDAIISLRSIYMPDESYDFASESQFYQKITKRSHLGALIYKNIMGNALINGKIIFRANKNVEVVYGNHAILLPKNRQIYKISHDFGIHIREFPFRSPNQSNKKTINNAIGHNYAGYKKSSRQKLHEKTKNISEEEGFKSLIVNGENFINDPFPIESIFKLKNCNIIDFDNTI